MDNKILQAAGCRLSEQQYAAVAKSVELYAKAVNEQTRYAAMVEAAAGSGKTYTCKAIIKTLKTFNPDIRICYLVFGKSNQVEMAESIPESLATVKTFHSAGFTAFSKALKGIRLNTENSKISGIMQEINVPVYLRSVVKSLVDQARNRVFKLDQASADYVEIFEHFALEADLLEADTDLSLDELLDQAISLAKQVLKISNQEAYSGLIDFTDQLYIAALDKAILASDYQKYDVIIIDECQDSSEVRRVLADKLAKPTSLIVAVGDRFQAIMGFSGADNDAVDKIVSRFNAVTLPLNVTYRCPKAVVRFAKELLPEAPIVAHESAPEGQVISIGLSDIFTLINNESYVICRYNKPLLEIGFGLLAKGIACQILGRDIANGLVKLTKKWKSVKTLDQLSAKLTAWSEEQTAKLIAKGKEAAADVLKDQVECLMFFIENMPHGSKLVDLQNKINLMFVDENGNIKKVATLMSCHKSKGREANNVFWVGRAKFQPSKLARKDWQRQQERNLLYVSATRAKQTLYDVHI